MYKNTIKGILRSNLSNLPGWRTNRKIVVVESDDWGSVHTFSKQAFERMKNAGLNVDDYHYGNDALESNDDLEMLFSSLSEFKDMMGHPPVFTSMCNVANPDFDKIALADFQEYFVQPLFDTVSDYNNHDSLLSLWKKGNEEGLFYPALHGREHINIRRYMDLLRSGDSGMRLAFKNRSLGASAYEGKVYPNYLGALYPTSMEEVNELHKILEDAGSLFEKQCGYKPLSFIAPNAEEPRELKNTLSKIGIKYITRPKRSIYPLGDGNFKSEWNWLGKKNDIGQTILVRNCFFEPVCSGEKDKEYITNWVDHCLKEMEISFRWHKPAVISSHRVNYIGHIDPKNREKGIKALRTFLKAILKK